jgi:predicted ferric reductase
MKATVAEIAAWIGLFVLLALAPLALAGLGDVPAPRAFWIELGVGLGFVALALMGLQFALTGRFASVGAKFGLDNMLQFHRQAGLVATGLVLGHVAVLILADPAYLAFFDPRVNAPRALALTAVLGSLVLIVGLTLRRQRVGLSYEHWRATHGALAGFVVLVGLAHVLMVGHYVSLLWKQLLWVAMTGAALALLVHARLVRPSLLAKRPFEVVSVRPERGRCWTLRLRAVGHPGMRFVPGQFAWLTLGPTPFSLQQHPFSFASSAEDTGGVELTIKELGDFTGGIGAVTPGTRAFLEGPYGAFTPDLAASAGVVLIVGGIGITPVMSMLRTFRDRADRRPLLLVYGSPSWEEITFREAIEDLRAALDLRVVHVLERPPHGWEGETGRITPDLLDRHLPDDPGRALDYFVCGPEPMMDAVERGLIARGVPLRTIFSERFAIV